VCEASGLVEVGFHGLGIVRLCDVLGHAEHGLGLRPPVPDDARSGRGTSSLKG
jgi:hypothetical protein